MTTFTHNGVEITLGANGKFTAQTPNGRITAASLDAIKKKLDKPADFEPFKAFTLHHWGTRIRECTVTGLVKGRGRHKGLEWQTSAGVMLDVYIDTPENRAAAQAYFDMAAEHAAIKSAMDEKLGEARDAIVSRRAGEKLV